MNQKEQREIISAYIQNTEYATHAYFAGGCVRDWILNISQGSDIDICVELPEGGIGLAKLLQPKFPDSQIIYHPLYGTAKLKTANLNLEFVATRKEQYQSGSRYPCISFGTLKDDVLRRDFTINALLQHIYTGKVFDLSGKGLTDLHQGLIRCIGEPVTRFQEDPLRLLRAMRFALKFGFKVEPATRAAMQSEGGAISRLSKATISQEISKLKEIPISDVSALLDSLGWDKRYFY